MPKNLSRGDSTRSMMLVGVVFLLSTLWLSACSRTASGTSATVSAHAFVPNVHLIGVVTIPQAQDVFDPFIQTIAVRGSITWHNDDTVSHTISTTWDQSAFLNPEAFSMLIPAGESATFSFNKPGLYHYFDSTQATWNKVSNRVVAKKGVPNFPLAMDGVIWVQGSVGTLQATGQNMIPSGQDDFATEFLAIPRGGSVSWHNKDTDGHTLASVFGWTDPVNPTTFDLTQINGTNAVPNGETKTLTFDKPGLYYYYCPNHATVNTQWHRAQAIPAASLFPIPMEGFVLVMGK